MEENLENIIANGALIIDVRTAEEYKEGHIEGSLNIPLDEIGEAMTWLVKDVPAVVVCASGSRSEVAVKILKANGFEKIYNGGSWNSFGNIKVGACPIK
ncbi:MAG TPA: rhodanese-like domain-containing protein [Candidatus Nanoarchaeia archaeon]|nr:rhodanese-like domain-containing protein [Candidatus Nanoarchaeia archaeon]